MQRVWGLFPSQLYKFSMTEYYTLKFVTRGKKKIIQKSHMNRYKLTCLKHVILFASPFSFYDLYQICINLFKA
jgi:hypothetical protein